MYDFVIIDPASTEFNRGSFCYLPYIVYASLRKDGFKVLLVEDATIANIDNLPPAKQYAIALWSYPQVDACLVYNRFLKPRPRFFGYTDIIKAYGLPTMQLTDDVIINGIKWYAKYYHEFRTILLSDCDMHLKKYRGKVYPLFTSYGCPRGCSFCPSTRNCGNKRLTLATNVVRYMLDIAVKEQGVRAIHFTDEDFFMTPDRTADILKTIINMPYELQLIALAHAGTLRRFLAKHGSQILHDAGVKLIEVGFETADESLSRKMNKQGHEDCLWLADYMDTDPGFDIFWLTLTFFPGETITTLNKTGQFIRINGFRRDELYGRIQTNGTEGGLGQFFQPYHGVPMFDDLPQLGLQINPRPIRLIPSFIPYSFLEDVVHVERKPCYADTEWLDLYDITAEETEAMGLHENYTVADHVFLGDETPIDPGGPRIDMTFINRCIAMAIFARLGIISSGEE